MDKKINYLFKNLEIDCENCFGLCCVSLFFSKIDGFPIDKEAGTPCIHLKEDFKCEVHKDLTKKGFRGCTGYDCFGAGQKLSQITFRNKSWRKNNKRAKKIFDSFLIMRHLHELLWYLSQAYSYNPQNKIKEKIELINKLTLLEADELLKLNIKEYRERVNPLLRKVTENIKLKYQKNKFNKKDCFALDLRKENLVAVDMSGACLIAANLENLDLTAVNFIGADMRDCNIKGADLSNSLFLTQGQINTAVGDKNTKLADIFTVPSYWL